MFTVLRQTIRRRMQAKLNEVKAELRRRMHNPIPEFGRWLRSVVSGHFRYYAVPMNVPALQIFRFQVALALVPHAFASEPEGPDFPGTAAAAHGPLAASGSHSP